MRAWFSLFGLAAAARLAYLFQFRPSMDSAYWQISENLARTGSLAINGAPVTDYEPLYLAFLAAARILTGHRVVLVQILQIAVASLGAVFLYLLSLALTGSKRAAAIGGVLFAVHPLLVRQASAASDLSLVTTLLVAFAYAFVSMRGVAGAAIAGLLIGLTVLTRSMALPIVAGGAVLLVAARKTPFVVAFVVAATLLIAPFIVRNHVVSGSWWPTRSGMALYVGNSPDTAALLPEHDLDLLQETADTILARELSGLSPETTEYAAQADAVLTRHAVTYMMERPFVTLGRKILNVAYLFSPRLAPSRIAVPETRVRIGPAGEAIVEGSVTRPRVETIAHGVATTFVLITAVAGVYLRRRQLGRNAILWIVAAVFVGVNAVYVPATRYMAPMLFVLLFYSGVALSELVSLKRPRERG